MIQEVVAISFVVVLIAIINAKRESVGREKGDRSIFK
jgi:hypothetical protein